MSGTNNLTLGFSSLLLWSCQALASSESLRITHPDDSSKQVEYFLERPSGKGPWPTVVLLHGHQEGAKPGGRDFLDWGVLHQLAGRGYLAVAISQPGYGQSSGPADFCGLFTQHAVLAVIARLRIQGLVAPRRLLLEGISRGALTAGLVATQDQSVTGLVLISGVYDLQAYIADPNASAAKKSVVASIVAETAGDMEALKARSALRYARHIKAATLILNGAKDDRTDPNQALELADQIVRGGGTARAIVYPDFGHSIPIEVRNKVIDPFIDKVLGAGGHGRQVAITIDDLPRGGDGGPYDRANCPRHDRETAATIS